ncbi:MAG: hypothetical protein FJY07_09860, partial [Bacteroidetes bacterium]|nr:hypothetical protein [Bacteroidota bacterium]
GAKTLFEKKDYQNALPLYAQLVSVHPENAEYNFCLGVCTLFGDRKDKKKPIRYLNNAAPSMKDNAELNYYLGLAYHQNQEFANAMKYYNLYLSKLTSGAPERALILEKINACLNGLNLIDKNLVSEQISKSNFQKDNFHRGYAAEDLPGSLVIKPDLFQSEKDKKSGEINFVFITQPDNVLLFSGYSGSGVDNKDIYIVVKQAAGEWGTPEKLDETINTSYDENYPVLADDGNTLYFCSKGHNSLGGYDIYRSKFDQTEKKFGQPENLGPGINSPFDDVLFIPAIEKEFAWFSSDRDNLNGSISVFKVRLTDNPFHEKTLLADNSGTGNDTPSENAGMVKSDNKEPEVKNNISENRSEASKKGMNIMNDRAKSAALTDSVFTIIANTKDLIRELTNRRDRANAISQRKSSEAKELELRFESEIAALALIQNKEQFEHDLEKTVKLKEEIMQLNQRADQANKIAWILGNQIKLKNEELVVLKNTAAKIQTSSLSGTYEETLVLYTEFVNHTETSDTLADFSTQLVSITNNEVKYKIPEGEFVFADKLKKAFSDNTLLAELNNQKQTIKKDIPIVVVDKTSGAQNTKTIQNLAAKNTLVAFALVEPVTFQEKDLITSLLSAEQLVIRFSQDNTMKPYTLVQPVLYNTIAFNTMPPDVNLEINFNKNMISANDIKPVVQQVAFNNSKYNTLPDESDIELRFTADQVNPAKLVQPVIANMNDFNAIAQSENLEINFEADKPVGMEAFQLVQPVFVHDLASSDFVNDEMLEINFNTDRSPINDIGQIIDPVYASFNFNTLPDISALEINFLNDQVTPFKITEPVYANFAYRNPTENEEIEINFNNDKTEAILIAGNIEPVTIMNSSDANAVREENLETGFEIYQQESAQAIALVEPVISGYDSFGFQPDEPDLEISYTVDENI